MSKKKQKQLLECENCKHIQKTSKKITQCKCGVCGRVGQFKTFKEMIDTATVKCD